MTAFSAALLAGSMHGAFVAALLLSRSALRSTANRFLAALVAICALTNLEDFALQTDLYKSFPAFAGFSLPLLPLIGPLLYLHVDALTDTDSFRMRQSAKRLIVPLLCWLMLIPFFALPGDIRFGLMTDSLPAPPLGGGFALILIYVITSVQIFTSIASAFRLLHEREAKLDPARASRVGWIRGLLWIALCCWAAYVIAILLATLMPDALAKIDSWAGLVQVAGLYALGYLGLTRPDTLFTRPQILPDQDEGEDMEAEAGGTAKYARSALARDDCERLIAKATDALRDDDLLLDPLLSLPRLAAAVGTSTNQISQAINLLEGCNFLQSPIPKYFALFGAKHRPENQGKASKVAAIGRRSRPASGPPIVIFTIAAKTSDGRSASC